MKKEEVREIDLGGHKAMITFKSPKEKLAEKKRIDKLNSMRIAMTYIENQGIKATPEKAIEIADEFLAWLEKK